MKMNNGNGWRDMGPSGSGDPWAWSGGANWPGLPLMSDDWKLGPKMGQDDLAALLPAHRPQLSDQKDNWLDDDWDRGHSDSCGDRASMNADNAAKLGKSGLASANPKDPCNGLASRLAHDPWASPARSARMSWAPCRHDMNPGWCAGC